METKSKRLISLDAFRGITIAMMIMVNNPGTWSKIYPPLRHATWNGWTFTDLIFPFFLFIVGVAIILAFSRGLERGISKKELYPKILRRTLILFGLGVWLNGFAGMTILNWIIYIIFLVLIIISFLLIKYLSIKRKDDFLLYIKRIFQIVVLAFMVNAVFYYDFSSLRIPGVLQRIAICYAVVSLIVLKTDIKWQVYITFGILIVYWFIMKIIPVPGYGAGLLEAKGSLCWYIDSILLKGHTWSHAPAPGFDPEGILSTLPAISTTLLGVLTGQWLKTEKNNSEKVNGMFVAGVIGLLSGIIVSIWFPMNKNLWSSSYVLFMGGMSLLFLATLYWIIEIQGYKSFVKPFVIFGSNAIILYTLSSFGARMIGSYIRLPLAGGESIALKTFLYKNVFSSFLSPVNASLAFAIFYILIWFALAYILYRKKIFIKV